MITCVRSIVSGAALTVVLSHCTLAQDTTGHRSAYATGLSFQTGLGTIALRDEFISREKYSGGLSHFGVGWSRFHGDHAFEFTLDYARSSTIRNFNASTTITQFSLRQAFLYPLPRFRLFSRDAYVFLGPSAELSVFLNEPQVAVANPNFTESVAALLSLGVSSEVIAPLGHGFQTELSMQVSVLSLGIRVVDPEEDDVSAAKLLTPVSGLIGEARVAVCYRFNRYLSAVISGGVHVLRISSWDPLVTVNNDLAIGLTLRL
jgi:hypothetical protein